jgi:hypothetical protein
MKTPAQLSELTDQERAQLFREALTEIYGDSKTRMRDALSDLDISDRTYMKYRREGPPVPILCLLLAWRTAKAAQLTASDLRHAAARAMALADRIEADLL